MRECKLKIERIMTSYIPELKADNSENFPQKFTDSTNPKTMAPEIYPFKHHAIDSDECQQNESPADLSDIHY